MSEPLQDEAEVLDGLPVLADEPSGTSAFPAPTRRALVGPLSAQTQTVAVAAGSFVAGAAVLGLARRRHSRRASLERARTAMRPARGRGKRSKSVGEIVEVLATRTFLVDVHLLGSPSGRNR